MTKTISVGLISILMLFGSGLPAWPQDVVEDPARKRALELFQALIDAGDVSDSKKLVDGWLVALRKEFGREHPILLMALSASGRVAYEQGAYGEARRLFEKQVELARKVRGPEHPETLTAMGWLAGMLGKMGDFPAAYELEKEIFDVRRRLLGAEHPDTLTAIANLAGTLRAQGDFSGARQRYEEVVEARRRLLGAEHPDTLTAIANLAGTLFAQGDFSGARQREEEVVEASRRLLGAEHRDTLVAMHNLASTLEAIGDLDGALKLYEQVAKVERRKRGADSDPTTLEEAVTLFALAEIHSAAGRFEQANKLYLSALDALEGQSETFDLSEDTKTRFRSSKQTYYRAAISHLLRQGQVEEALHVLERYRAQSLLTLMRWGMPGKSGKPTPVVDAELREIARRFDSVTTELERLDPVADHRKQDSLRAERALLQRRLEVLRGQSIRASFGGTSKRIAPLRFEEIQRHLDPGTVLLAYSVGNERVDLFVLAKEGPLEVHALPTSQLELWLQWARFFPLLFPASEANEPTSLEEAEETADPDARIQLGRWLYDRLLAPAGERLASSRRVLILPDGPLHYLPFSALVRPAPDDPRGWQYLAEWKPIHVAQSATVYAELQKRRRAPASEGEALPQTLVALGDPSYPPPREGEPVDPTADRNPLAWLPLAVRSAENRGLFDGLTPLPNTQREITEIGKLFPEALARTYLGTDATEERAKAELSKARYIHLAAHGLADPDVPANSFIALTIPEGLPADRDNGILQGWEIMDTLRLDADLVVLSACVTAFGPNRGGEGLMSLSRAFQIAGARTVAASLWPVADDSTAELMIRFYRHLLAGEPKDEALRVAQMELIAGPITFVNADGETVTRDFSAPYHWAAFQLIGDWQ